MKLAQLKDGYRYNSDTMVLYDFITSQLRSNFSGRILDVGCGCGIVGLLLKRDFAKCDVSLLDIQRINLEISAHNAMQNGLKVSVNEADFAKFKSEIKFDLIVSNPPYYHGGVKRSSNEHIAISRYENALNLIDFVASASSNLAPRGELMFCYEASGLAEIFIALRRFKFTPIAIKFAHPKMGVNANLALVRAKKSSRSRCEILPPFFMHEELGYSRQAREIFERAACESVDYEAEAAKC